MTDNVIATPLPVCPFCGTAPNEITDRGDEHSVWVACSNHECPIYAEGMTHEQWGCRSPDSIPVSEIEALEAELREWTDKHGLQRGSAEQAADRLSALIASRKEHE